MKKRPPFALSRERGPRQSTSGVYQLPNEEGDQQMCISSSTTGTPADAPDPTPRAVYDLVDRIADLRVAVYVPGANHVAIDAERVEAENRLDIEFGIDRSRLYPMLVGNLAARIAIGGAR